MRNREKESVCERSRERKKTVKERKEREKREKGRDKLGRRGGREKAHSQVGQGQASQSWPVGRQTWWRWPTAK